MAQASPIKRAKALEPLSHDHHHGLVLCRRIKTGLEGGAEVARIMRYARYVYEQELHPHFSEEEEFLFPLLDPQHPQIQRALQEHRELYHLFFNAGETDTTCRQIAALLKEHIRFEERVLFNTLQNKASPAELKAINAKLHARPAVSPSNQWDDLFWEFK